MTFEHAILLAHGSRDSRWAQPFHDMTTRISSNHANVSLAFMELCSPSIEEAVNSALASGSSNIAVLPLFFAAGKHLRVDVPAMLKRIEAEHPVTLTLLPPIGEHQQFIAALDRIVEESLSNASE